MKWFYIVSLWGISWTVFDFKVLYVIIAFLKITVSGNVINDFFARNSKFGIWKRKLQNYVNVKIASLTAHQETTGKVSGQFIKLMIERTVL